MFSVIITVLVSGLMYVVQKFVAHSINRGIAGLALWLFAAAFVYLSLDEYSHIEAIEKTYQNYEAGSCTIVDAKVVFSNQTKIFPQLKYQGSSHTGQVFDYRQRKRPFVAFRTSYLSKQKTMERYAKGKVIPCYYHAKRAQLKAQQQESLKHWWMRFYLLLMYTLVAFGCGGWLLYRHYQQESSLFANRAFEKTIVGVLLVAAALSYKQTEEGENSEFFWVLTICFAVPCVLLYFLFFWDDDEEQFVTDEEEEEQSLEIDPPVGSLSKRVVMPEEQDIDYELSDDEIVQFENTEELLAHYRDKIEAYSEPPTFKDKLISLFGGSLFLGVGLLGCFFVVQTTYQLVQAKQWYETECQIDKIWIERHSDSDGDTFSIEAKYRYHFQGKEYKGSNFDLKNSSISWTRGLRKKVEKIRQQQRVPCFVNPEKPSESTIETTIGWFPLYIFLALAFVWAGWSMMEDVVLSALRRVKNLLFSNSQAK